jgi:hypothetical protein
MCVGTEAISGGGLWFEEELWKEISVCFHRGESGKFN